MFNGKYPRFFFVAHVGFKEVIGISGGGGGDDSQAF